MLEKDNVPGFVSVVAIMLGCYDLLRGFMHTFLLLYSSVNIAGLNLSTSQAADLLHLLGAFGISNYISGVMLILVAWQARPLALIMLGVIPTAYIIGGAAIILSSANYPHTQANWGGAPMMVAYNIFCIISFIAGVLVTYYRQRRGLNVGP